MVTWMDAEWAAPTELEQNWIKNDVNVLLGSTGGQRPERRYLFLFPFSPRGSEWISFEKWWISRVLMSAVSTSSFQLVTFPFVLLPIDLFQAPPLNVFCRVDHRVAIHIFRPKTCISSMLPNITKNFRKIAENDLFVLYLTRVSNFHDYPIEITKNHVFATLVIKILVFPRFNQSKRAELPGSKSHRGGLATVN